MGHYAHVSATFHKGLGTARTAVVLCLLVAAGLGMAAAHLGAMGILLLVVGVGGLCVLGASLPMVPLKPLATVLARGRRVSPGPASLQVVEALAQLYQRLDALEQHAEQQERMSMVGQLAGGVAHDLNNLLTASVICTEQLADVVQGNEMAEEAVELLRQSTTDAGQLTRQMLALSRGRSRETAEVLQPNDVVHSRTRLLQSLVGKAVKLRIQTHERTGQVRVDPHHLEMVLLNLVLNARDATPPGGLIDVTVQPGRMGGAELVVKDRGCGMDERVRSRIFEPFFTTKPDGRGTGLGLFVVDHLVRRMGGQVEVNSTLGRGTTFKVVLPSAN